MSIHIRRKGAKDGVNVHTSYLIGNHYMWVLHTVCSHRGCMRMESEDLLLYIAVLVILLVTLYGISVPIISALGT